MTKLNQMSTAVRFVSAMPIVISLKRSATQSISAATNTAVQWNVSEVDSDSMHSTTSNNSRIVAQTPGYYKFHSTLSAASASSAVYWAAWYQITTGSNNPGGAGNTSTFARSSFLGDTTSGDYRSVAISSITPYLYIGDYVEVYVYSGSSTTLQYLLGSSGHLDSQGNGDGTVCLTAYYLFEGP